MPSPLSADDADLLVNTVDTPDLAQGSSAVVNWNGRFVLIYHGFPITDYPDGIYYYTDISDLPAATITQLGLSTEVHGILYYLPAAITETVQVLASTVGSNAVAFAAGVGKAVGGLTQPLVSNFTPILIGAAVLLALIYLPKPR